MAKELVEAINEKSNTLTIEREEADRQGLMYKASKIFIFNRGGENLVIKRSMTANGCPGLYDLGVSETVIPLERYKEAALRGLDEELGIQPDNETELKFLCAHKYDHGRMKRVYQIFVLQHDGAVNCSSTEVEEARFMGQEELERLLKKEELFVPAGLELWGRYEALTKDGPER